MRKLAEAVGYRIKPLALLLYLCYIFSPKYILIMGEGMQGQKNYTRMSYDNGFVIHSGASESLRYPAPDTDTKQKNEWTLKILQDSKRVILKEPSLLHRIFHESWADLFIAWLNKNRI